MSTEVFDNLISSTSLESLLSILLDKLAAQRENQKKILYVAGAISSDGDHKIAENVEKLLNYRRRLTAAYADLAFVFASPDIFTPEVYERLRIFELPRHEREQAFQDFYDRVIEPMHLDGIYLTPGWQRSTGAKREFEKARRSGIPIHYLD